MTKTILAWCTRRPQRARRELVGEIEREPRGGAPARRGTQRPRTLIVFGRENFALRGIYASGGYGFIHDMVTAAGGENVFADVKQQAVQATTELIMARRPDVILELRADPLRTGRDREVGAWNQLASVPAVRTRRVHIIIDPRTVVPGPRVAEGVEVIARVLHGGQ